MPTAAMFATHGFKALGIDIDEAILSVPCIHRFVAALERLS